MLQPLMEFYPFERCDSKNSHIFIKIKIVIIIMIFFACFPAAFGVWCSVFKCSILGTSHYSQYMEYS